MTARDFPNPADAATFLTRYGIGPIGDLAARETDSCYRLQTTREEFVLGFSSSSSTEPLFAAELTTFLTAQGIPCAALLADSAGRLQAELNGWSATVEGPLSGFTVARPTADHCGAVGEGLARLHVASLRFPYHKQNERGPTWWRQTANELFIHLTPPDQALLKEELRFQSLHRFSDLPHGAIHGRFVREHLRFEGGQVKEITGFHHACSDMLLLDVAIAVGDWCQAGEELDRARASALLEAYAGHRPLNSIERGAWPVLLRSTALEQWLSTLAALHLQECTHRGADDDAEAAKARLLHRIGHEYDARALWPTMNRRKQA